MIEVLDNTLDLLSTQRTLLIPVLHHISGTFNAATDVDTAKEQELHVSHQKNAMELRVHRVLLGAISHTVLNTT